MRHVPFALLFAVSVFLVALAISVPLHADTGSASTGSAATATSSPAMPSTGSVVADPLEHPLVALDEVKLARQTSWPLLVGLCLVMLTKALAYGSLTLQTVPVIGVAARWLAVGKHAMAIAAAGTLAAAGYNTLVAGGTWVAALIAAGLAGAGLMHSTTQPVSKLPTATLTSGIVAGLVAAVISIGFIAQLPACGTTGGGVTPVVTNTVIDCAGSNAGKVATLFSDLKAKLLGGGSWALIEADAKSAGMAVGGCALSQLVQDYLGGKGAPASGDSSQARAALEDFRSTVAGGASFKLADGRLL